MSRLFDGFTNISDEIIEEALDYEDKILQDKKKRIRLLRVGGYLAACMALFLIVGSIALNQIGTNNTGLHNDSNNTKGLHNEYGDSQYDDVGNKSETEEYTKDGNVETEASSGDDTTEIIDENDYNIDNETVSDDMPGYVVYQGKYYGEVEVYYDEEAEQYENIVGEKIGETNIDDELVSNLDGLVYSVNGYDVESRICMMWINAETNEKCIEIFDRSEE